MMRFLLKSKIHKARVTEANLHYIGSITIDEALLQKANLWPGEKVLVTSNTSGNRLETYIIKGKKNSGTICVNGACSKRIGKGEEIIIMAFTESTTPIRAKCILVDKKNKFVKYL